MEVWYAATTPLTPELAGRRPAQSNVIVEKVQRVANCLSDAIEMGQGRGKWETTVAAVVRNRWAPSIAFLVFDGPEIAGCWSKRIATAARKLRCNFAAVIPHETVNDLVHVSLMFRRIRERGGEGLILRRPGVSYSTQRTADVLKLKACPITGELRWAERRRHAA